MQMVAHLSHQTKQIVHFQLQNKLKMSGICKFNIVL